MRFTVKAKLASAFGAVIILSTIIGVIAYTKLTALDASQQGLVLQAGRMKLAARLMDEVQGQQRAQTRMILATSDKETADNLRVMIERQDAGLKIKDELYGVATEQGKRLIEQATVKYQRMNELFAQAGKFALLNSNNRAAEIWNSDGMQNLSEFNSAVDVIFADIGNAPATIENTRALLALQTAKLEAARFSRSVTATFAASTMEELEAGFKAAAAQLEKLKASTAPASVQVTAMGLPVNNINISLERLSKTAEKALTTVREGGSLKALAIVNGEARKAFNEALAGFEEYIKFSNGRMNELAAAGTEEAAFAKILLISIIIASLLIAVGSALWIALNISRGLGRAVDLANAVAIGDLSQKIDVSSNDEIGDLVKSLNGMTVNLNATAKIADSIAGGDLTIDAKPLSDKDTLGLALERMVQKLRAVVSDTLIASQNMSAGSQELSASAEQLSQGATEQASASEEASASMEEMAANVKQNAENASQTEK
ncbi:MAG: methyl-accepting chemotaxis sensory transducer, partial [Ramlibacter sp.]|nr:methyl-accepting chemotaxis sensory transducer [Ramlibacter sp.]